MGQSLKVHLIATRDRRGVNLNALGIASLAGHIRGTFPDVDVRLHDVVDPDRVSEDLLPYLDFGPKTIMGFSVMPMSSSSFDAVKSAYLPYLTRQEIPDGGLLHVFGNQLPTYYPEHFLRSGLPNPIVVKGAGEVPLEMLVRQMSNAPTVEDMGLSDIPNLRYLDRTGKVVRTRSQAFDPGTTILHAPATDLIPENADCAHIIASKGCEGRCTFCTRRWFYGHPHRPLALTVVRDSIFALAEKGVKNVEFSDDDFIGSAADLDRTRAICQIIREVRATTGNQFSFRITLSADYVAHPEVKQVLSEMKQVGLEQVTFGLETVSKSQERRYRKKATVEESLAALKILSEELQLRVYGGFLMFDPCAQLDDLVANIVGYLRNRLYRYNSWCSRPMWLCSKTPYVGIARRKGLLTGGVEMDICALEYRFEEPLVQDVVVFDQALVAQPFVSLLNDIGEWQKLCPGSLQAPVFRSFLDAYSIICLNALFLVVSGKKMEKQGTMVPVAYYDGVKHQGHARFRAIAEVLAQFLGTTPCEYFGSDRIDAVLEQFGPEDRDDAFLRLLKGAPPAELPLFSKAYEECLNALQDTAQRTPTSAVA